jgi:hypothetical protein
METQYDTIQTNIYFDIFTCIDDDSTARLRMATADLESIEQEETQDNELSAVSEKIATTGKNLERQSEELAGLLREAAELEKKIEAVRVQTTQAGLVCQLVRASLSQLLQNRFFIDIVHLRLVDFLGTLNNGKRMTMLSLRRSQNKYNFFICINQVLPPCLEVKISPL